MGYSYSLDGKLCCDGCSRAGGVRKRRCPYGYCQSPALCAPCLRKVKADGRWNKSHLRCKAGMEDCIRKEQKRLALLDLGHAVRCSALNEGENVRVWFRYADGSTVERVMAPETYRAIPLGEPATLADFEKYGAVWAAPNPKQEVA